MPDVIRVVLVDDEIEYPMDILTALGEELERLGRRAEFHFMLLGDPESAIARIDSGQIDILITDNRMGEITGMDLAQRVRKTEICRNIPIIMVTKDITGGIYPDKDAKFLVRAGAAGVDKVIEKFELLKKGAEFLTAIDELLAQKAKEHEKG